MDQQARLHDRRRTGQTLAEFAITLPILLLLLFGIIEFGRIFQAWVTLQNSARAAARYATTGVYNTDKYKLDLNVYDPNLASWHGDIDSIVPCYKNEPIDDTMSQGQKDLAKQHNLAQRGVSVTYDSTTSGFNTLDPIHAFQDGPESIYATYYSGDDCDPSDSDDQNRRKDLARILSIYDEARIGAAGLALGAQLPPTPEIGVPGFVDNWPNWSINLPAGTHYPAPNTVPWYQVWDRPIPGTTVTPAEYNRLRHSDEKGWFDLTICSSRPLLDESDTHVSGDGDGRFRFPTVLELAADRRAPVCLLEEQPSAALALEDWTNNVDRPWWDAGGPGDTVSLVVTFNHPLITPLGLASFLPLQARRVAVNEAFRAPRAVPPSYSLPDQNTLQPTNTMTPTVVGTSTFTPTATDSLTPTNTATSTDTPTPSLVCGSSVTTGGVAYRNDRIDITLTNMLPYNLYLKQAHFVWTAPTGYSAAAGSSTPMLAAVMYIGSSAIWAGTDTDADHLTDVGNNAANGNFGSNANLVLAPGVNTWTMQFINGPLLNTNNMPATVFNNTIFYYDVLNGSGGCSSVLNYGTPTPTFTPLAGTPTPTATLDCVGDRILVSAAKFDMSDVIRFDVTNFYTGTQITVTGFSIQWSQPGSQFKLSNVYGGGSGSTLSPDSLPIWADPSGGTTTHPTTGTQGGPNWQNNFTIGAGETKPIYILFTGGTGLLPLNQEPGGGFTAQTFYGTFFTFNAPLCGIIETEPASTLAPTSTPTPTPTDTFTPTITPTPIPITLAAVGVCDTVGNVTFTVTNVGNPIPSTASFNYSIYWSTTFNNTHRLTTGSFSGPLPPPVVLPAVSVGTHYNQVITLRITNANIPAGYDLTQNPTFNLGNTPTCIAPTPTITKTPTPVTPTNTPTITKTPTPVTPTQTPTITKTPTPVTPTQTPTQTKTPTPVTPTDTPTQTKTPTPVTPTQTPTQTKTPTPVTPTNTQPPTNTPTATKTNTPAPPPTATPTPTRDNSGCQQGVNCP